MQETGEGEFEGLEAEGWGVGAGGVADVGPGCGLDLGFGVVCG